MDDGRTVGTPVARWGHRRQRHGDVGDDTGTPAASMRGHPSHGGDTGDIVGSRRSLGRTVGTPATTAWRRGRRHGHTGGITAGTSVARWGHRQHRGTRQSLGRTVGTPCDNSMETRVTTRGHRRQLPADDGGSTKLLPPCRGERLCVQGPTGSRQACRRCGRRGGRGWRRRSCWRRRHRRRHGPPAADRCARRPRRS